MATIRTVLESKSTDIITIDGNVTLSEAVAIMASKEIGALVMQGDKQPEGIITERDILKDCGAKKRRPKICRSAIL